MGEASTSKRGATIDFGGFWKGEQTSVSPFMLAVVLVMSGLQDEQKFSSDFFSALEEVFFEGEGCFSASSSHSGLRASSDFLFLLCPNPMLHRLSSSLFRSR